MAEYRIAVEIPESRRLVLTLPPEVPTGKAELFVSFDTEKQVLEMPPFEVDLSGPPYYPPARPSDPFLLPEYESFRRMLPDLLKTNAGQYVAISGGKVIAGGQKADEVVATVCANSGERPVYGCLVARRVLVPRSSFQEICVEPV